MAVCVCKVDALFACVCVCEGSSGRWPRQHAETSEVRGVSAPPRVSSIVRSIRAECLSVRGDSLCHNGLLFVLKLYSSSNDLRQFPGPWRPACEKRTAQEERQPLCSTLEDPRISLSLALFYTYGQRQANQKDLSEIPCRVFFLMSFLRQILKWLCIIPWHFH